MIKYSLVRINLKYVRKFHNTYTNHGILYKYCIINLINHDDKDIRKIDLSYKNLNLLVR